LVNGYGPTETTVFATFYTIGALGEEMGSVPIGRPLRHGRVYILEEEGTGLQPVGVWGEICMGGSQVGWGYIGEPELTRSKFVEDPFVKGGRMYRSGDIGRYLPDGNIEYLRRRDEMVKVRGYRIEPGEIEKALEAMPGMVQCRVVVRQDTLYAYYRSEREAVSGELRTYLSGWLPEYMIPSRFIRVESFSVTANGKLDLSALPQAMGGKEEPGSGPQTDTELQLRGLWATVLDLEEQELPVNASFFEMGGHSLNSAQLVSEIKQLFHVDITLKQVMGNTTIRRQAAIIEDMTLRLKALNEILERIENE
jgi:acyl-CoA synthetase (AMP-forming)/AMP-acid ligase II/acyl carrier protein